MENINLDFLLHHSQNNESNKSMRPHLMVVGWAQDNPQIVQLAASDFHLHFAANMGDSQCRLGNSGRIDAILLNKAAAMDVYGVTAALRFYTQTPIVLLFADEEPVNPMRAVAVGADDWLPGSIHPVEFTARVYARIRRHLLAQVESRVYRF
jgi:DNA-binding response OmpR family regulator